MQAGNSVDQSTINGAPTDPPQSNQPFRRVVQAFSGSEAQNRTEYQGV